MSGRLLSRDSGVGQGSGMVKTKIRVSKIEDLKEIDHLSGERM